MGGTYCVGSISVHVVSTLSLNRGPTTGPNQYSPSDVTIHVMASWSAATRSLPRSYQ